MLAPMAEAAEITLDLNLKNDCPVLILEDDLYQIIFNLMENGIKYNLPGGVLKVTLNREDDNAVLTVSDSGVGIPEDAIVHIFERFYRVDKARNANHSYGLGLSIAESITKEHGGRIWAESDNGINVFKVKMNIKQL
jgi:signal transduction histidine kinase